LTGHDLDDPRAEVRHYATGCDDGVDDRAGDGGVHHDHRLRHLHQALLTAGEGQKERPK
jgi:hypothetical protein